MIVEYAEDGTIIHIVNDPVPVGLVDIMLANGAVLIDLPPVQTPEGLKFAEVDFMRDFVNVTTKEISSRPVIDMPSEVNLKVGETTVLSGLPDPIHLLLDGEPVEITGGELELSGDMPSSYILTVNQFPYMPSVTKVVVNEA